MTWQGNWKIQGKSLAVRSLITSLAKNFGHGSDRSCFSASCFLRLLSLLLPLVQTAPGTEWWCAEFLDNLFITVLWVFPCFFQSLVVWVWRGFACFVCCWGFLLTFLLRYFQCRFALWHLWPSNCLLLSIWRSGGENKRDSCLFWFCFSSRACLRVNVGNRTSYLMPHSWQLAAWLWISNSVYFPFPQERKIKKDQMLDLRCLKRHD